MRSRKRRASDRLQIADRRLSRQRPEAVTIFGMLTIIGIIAVALPAAAASECDETDQKGMNECAYEQYQDSDKRLNQKYIMIMACLKREESQREQMMRAQRAWIKFKEAECEFQLGDNPKEPMSGGTMRPMLLSICEKELTEKRIKDFDAMIACAASGERGGICPTIDCDFDRGKKP